MVRTVLPLSSRKLLFLFLFCVTSLSYLSAQNPIITENALTGNPKTEWDISGAGDLSIQGFAQDISVNKGQTVNFKINVTGGAAYTIRIYRLGYYNGMGARLVANLGSFTGTVQNNTTTNTTTGLVDCSGWSVSASYPVPSTAVSGVYIAKLTRTSGSSHIIFVVRDDAANSPMLFKTSDATWQAYNVYGGNSLYVGSTSLPAGHASKVSYSRPFLTRNGGGGGGAMEDWIFNAEYPMIRFLERNGYNVSYATDVDMERDATPITPTNHKILLSVGHDEYWSAAERTKWENARAAGVHMAFFSGNEVYWKTRWEDNNKTLVCYKEGTLGENVCGSKCDPTATWTGLWRDGCSAPSGGACKPENALTGQISWSDVTGTLNVTSAYKSYRFWRFSSVAALNSGSVTMTAGTLGYEWDYDQYPDSYPNGRIVLSNTTTSGLVHKLSLYRHSSGALVFGAGTVQWSWGLDNIHDRGSAAVSPAMQQATINLFADMGVQPGSIMSGMTASPASTDLTAPTATITSPTSGATVPANAVLNITGTATEVGGGVLAGVEVSVDGGTTWRLATGTSSWSYSWTPTVAGTGNIRVRGFDDSGNMGVPGAVGSSSNINITVSAGVPASGLTIFQVSNTPATPLENDGSPIVLGVKFRSTQAGFITGIRYYKGPGASGAHTGTLWSSTGTKLGEIAFTGETASGWQQMLFTTPVAIAANTTYVASYFSQSGDYCNTNPYFTTAVTNGPLSALANGTDGVNGIYLYSATNAFPTANYQSSNYFVDVVFNATVDQTPPTVTSVVPAAASNDFKVNFPVTAIFSEAMTAASISTTTFELRDAASVLVPSTVTYNATTRTASLTPNANLLYSTAYTATIRGTATGVKDAAGNALAANYVWSFTSEPDLTPPTVTSVTPLANATNVSVNPSVTVLFNEAMLASSINGTTLVLRDPTTALVPATVTYNATTRTASLVVSAPLNTSTVYTVTVESGASGVKDVPGNALVTDYSWSFTTVATADLTPPTVTANSPANAATGVSLTASAAGVFSEAMDVATISATTVELRDAANALVTATISYNVGTRTVTITPSAALAYSTTYTAIIKSGATGVKDAAGNPLAANFTWTFTTLADVVAPTVTTVTPVNGATGVSVSTTTTAVFSEAINAATITASTIELRNAANALVATSLSFNAGTRTLTVTPTAALSANAVYTMIIKGGASGVKDLAGNPIATDYSWNFTTTSGAFTIFQVANTPATARTNDGAALVCGVRFRATQAGTITGIRYYKGAGGTGTHTGTLWSNTGTKLAEIVFTNETASGWQQMLFTTPVAITANTTYVASYWSSSGDYAITNPYWTTAVVNGPLRGLANNEDGLNGVYRYSTTVAFPNANYETSNYWVDVVFQPGSSTDVTPPTVTSVSPTNGATGVSLTTTVSAIFSEAINPATVTSATVELRGPGSVVIPSTITYNAGTRAAIITPNAALATSTVYTAVVKSGASGVKDAAGNALAADFTWSFTTAGDQIAPLVTSVTPNNGATGVTTSLVATGLFNEAMNASTISTSTVELRGPGNTLVATNISYNVGTNTVSITASSPCAHASVYTCIIKSGGSGVKDVAGNALAADYTWSFTTDADVSAPTVTSVTPVNGSTNVALSAVFTAVFNEAMNASTINTGTIELRSAGNNLVPSTVTFNAGTNTATLTPSAPLNNLTVYTVTILSGASGVKDAANNALANNYSWSVTSIADQVPPTVTVVTPANNATELNVATQPTVTFNEAMNPSSITNTTIELRDAGNALVPSTIIFDEGTRTATIIPNSLLGNNITYTVIVKSGTAGVKDAAGNALAADYSWHFTTVQLADIIPPTITSNTPLNGLTGIALNTSISATFSEAMNASTVTAASLELRDGANNLVAFTSSYTPGNGTVVLTPTAALTYSTAYTVTVKSGTGGVKDLAGNELASDFVWTFTTAADAVAPTVTSVTPVNGSTNISISNTLTAVFSEAMNESSINTGSFELRDAGNNLIPYSISYNAANRTATLTLTADLGYSSVYTATIKAGAAGVKDVANNELAADYAWSFTTVAAPDVTPPQIQSTVPVDNANDFPRTGSIAITFNEPIDPATVNTTTFELRALGLLVINTSVQYTASTNTVTINPTSQLSNFTPYSLTVKSGTSGVKDVVGNALASNFVLNFTTVTDQIAPTVTSVTPANNATGLALNSIATATFSEEMTASTINGSTVELRDAGNAIVPSTVTFNSTSNVATLTPTASLLNGITYTVRIISGSSGVKDAAGNALAATYSWSFTTIADQSAPLVTAVSPVNGATAINVNTALTATFNEAMTVSTINSSTIQLLAPGSIVVNSTITYSNGTNTLTITPNAALSNSTVYTGRLSTGVKDAGGNSIVADYTWTFTTQSDNTPPTISFVTPVSGATGVSVTPIVTAAFSEAMNAATITAATAELRAPGNVLVVSTVSYDALSKSVIITPNSTLANGTLYTARIVSGVSGVKDASGNALAADFSWSFTTEADVAAPTITSVTPASNASNVAVNTTMTAVFSEPMNASTINTTSIELRNQANTLVTTTVSYNASTRTVTITPTANLANSATYTVTIKNGASGVKDVGGNSIASNYAWSFNTLVNTVTIFQPNTTPAVFENDGQAIELGVKFRTSQAGFITGIRYYKGPGWTGSRTGTLWSSTGTKLAEAIFINESASGWQQVLFPTPISIMANTTYVASYFSPSGDYTNTNPYFTSATTNGPLTGLANGTDGPNGLYRYTATVAFPNANYGTSNYWVDVVFAASTGPDVTAPVIVSTSPGSGANGIATNATVSVSFNEGINPSTVTNATFELRDATNALVPSSLGVSASVATLTPSNTLNNSSQYTVTIRGGTSGVKDLAGNALAADFSWSFNTVDPPPPITGNGPGGPILVVNASSNPFSRYPIEILRAEGFNEFLAKDITTVTAADLTNYDVVILGEIAVTAVQATMFTNFVNSGGTLIAFRPSVNLSSLLGITKVAGSLADQYLLVNTSTGPGTGIVNQTIQFHGSADYYTLNGATSLATLYSTATTSTVYPAVTTRDVGASGGKAIAFTYDLSRSIVYTRQGNPAWAGQKRDNEAGPIRSDDLFFGGAVPDYVNLNKVAIPQADEQQRLLTNIIMRSNLHRKPLPRFWFLPRGLKAAIVMTGDDHGTNGTVGRFNQYLTLGPNTAADVADWKAIRGTSYIYNNTPITNAQAAAFEAQGFEIGLHLNTGCENYTPSSYLTDMTSQLAQLASQLPGISAPVSHRTHCLLWSDWATTPKVESQKGIRLDVNYYYWPADWVLNRPGMFTGSGMPMRFADTDGSLIDCYQATTQMTDESGISLPGFCDQLLDKALGAEGYYGVFTANMHTDTANHIGSNRIIASALARQVPVISAKQMLTWLDGRNNSSFGTMTWNNNQLTFPVTALSGARNLKGMLPTSSGTGTLVSITRNGTSIPFTIETIKGIQYAFFDLTTGTFTYLADYGAVGGRSSGEEPVVSQQMPKTEVVAAPISADFDVQVMPNPSNGYFNLQVKGSADALVNIKITDVTGKVVETYYQAAPNTVIRVGDKLKGGSYFAEVMQSGKRKVVKILKLN